MQEREADLRIEDLTSDLSAKQKRIDGCLRDLREMEGQAEQLQNDLNLRGKELQRARSEAQKEMKYDAAGGHHVNELCADR